MFVSTSSSSPGLSPFLFFGHRATGFGNDKAFVGTDPHTFTGGLFTRRRHHICWEQWVLDREWKGGEPSVKATFSNSFTASCWF